MILLDTHVLIWMAGDSPSLGRQTHARIAAAAAEGTRVAASAMALWEIASACQRGRLTVNKPIKAWIDDMVDGLDLVVLAIDGDIAAQAGMLPGDIHGDPGDRMMIASARTQRCPLVTADRKILAYAAAGHVAAIDARR